MTDRDHRRKESEDLNNDDLDCQLDAALAKYAAVEPRTGLEERILANLRVERERSATNSWWRWPAAAALAALLLFTVFVAWRSRKPSPDVATLPARNTQTVAHEGTPGTPQRGVVARPSREAWHRAQLNASSRRTPAPVLASAPKLDQFPSPQPLSEQETILARYVTKYPEHAALIAQARTEELQQDIAEDTGVPATENSPSWNK